LQAEAGEQCGHALVRDASRGDTRLLGESFARIEALGIGSVMGVSGDRGFASRANRRLDEEDGIFDATGPRANAGDLAGAIRRIRHPDDTPGAPPGRIRRVSVTLLRHAPDAQTRPPIALHTQGTTPMTRNTTASRLAICAALSNREVWRQARSVL
jgi:hypothetical protein